MSDQNPVPPQPSTPDPQQPPLVVNGQYVKDLSFEAPNTPQVFQALHGAQPEIKVDIDVQAEPKAQGLFEVVLKVRAEARAKEQLVYLLEIEYGGLFSLNVSEQQLGPVLLIECPLILFPFMRRIIADLTADGGFAPLMLSPIDFAQLYHQRVQQMHAQRQQTAQA